MEVCLGCLSATCKVLNIVASCSQSTPPFECQKVWYVWCKETDKKTLYL